mgnify:CR=1 FL=1
MDKLPEINSEVIEPYLKAFLMENIEGVAFGLYTPDEARQSLKGVDHFISSFGGIHSRCATSNMYGKFCAMSDEVMKEVCKKTFKDK